MRSEKLAFNNGISAALALAAKCSAALEARLTEAPTRFNFAIGALEAIAHEGTALFIEIPGPNDAAPVALPTSPAPAGPARVAVATKVHP